MRGAFLHKDVPIYSHEGESFADDEPVDEQSQSSDSNNPSHTDTSMLDLKTILEFPAIKRSESMEDLSILIHLKAPTTSTVDSPRAAVDIVAVLDVSGSMEGSKLDLLKKAMAFVVENLASRDRLSIVTFSTGARRVLRLTRMTEVGKTSALEAINALRHEGLTNIALGLKVGTKVLEERRQKNPVHSIILLSDGQDNCSLDDGLSYRKKDLLSVLPPSLVGGDESHRIPVHAFGFGTDHDAALMNLISEATGGTFSFVESPTTIQEAFAQCLGGLLSVVSQQLRVEIKCLQPGIRINGIRSGTYASRLTDERKTTGAIDVGDMYASEERDMLVSINLPCWEGEEEEEVSTALISIGCTYMEPVSKRVVELEEMEVRVRRPVEVKPEERVASDEVRRQKKRFEATAAIEAARATADKGDLAGAISMLRGLLRGLRKGDLLFDEVKNMEKLMGDRKSYESSGRAYMRAANCANLQQRAAAMPMPMHLRSGKLACGAPMLSSAYRTPMMNDMVERSQTQRARDRGDGRSSTIPPSTSSTPPTEQSIAGQVADLAKTIGAFFTKK